MHNEHDFSASGDRLSTFPAFFRVEGRQVAVFGNGDEAFAKVRLLANTNAHIIAYADEPEADFARYISENAIDHRALGFASQLIEGATLVFAATGHEALDREIVSAARAQHKIRHMLRP